MIPVLIGVSFIIFAMMYFTPGDPAQVILGDMATEEDLELFRAENGLNGGFLEQYVYYMKKVVTKGDLGTSYTTKQPVTGELLDRFPTTFKLAGISIIISVIIGIVVGIISATRQYSIFDNVCTIFSLIGVSMPNFWQGMILIIFFSVYMGWFPPSGFSTALGSPSHYHWHQPGGQYHAYDPFQYAGGDSAGLHPYSKSERSEGKRGYLETCIEKCADPDHHRSRTFLWASAWRCGVNRIYFFHCRNR